MRGVQAGRFTDYLNAIPMIAPHGEIVAIGITVAGVTYLSLVIGELLPKRLGLSYAAIASTSFAVNPEPGQPAGWKFLERPWTSTFPDDRDRICRYVAWLRSDGSKELPRP